MERARAASSIRLAPRGGARIALVCLALASCAADGRGEAEEPTPAAVAANDAAPRGYLTTPAELAGVRRKAEEGVAPHPRNLKRLLAMAEKPWDFELRRVEVCKANADEPLWNDNGGGTPILYAKALAYHLMQEPRHADEVATILERIMTRVERIAIADRHCQLHFAWGVPELVASADLIEDRFRGRTCRGPASTSYHDPTLRSGDCKQLFQNWLVKNPYYVVSRAAADSQSNWGAAATNTTAYIADYLHDRPEVRLLHRHPPQLQGGRDVAHSPADAFAYANRLALERMSGHRVEYASRWSCDYLGGKQQDPRWPPVKSQISERGIVPEDARRQESCNVPTYDGEYQNYPQLHLGHNIQQCELMLRRGDRSCYDHVAETDLPGYRFVDPKGRRRATHLRAGRGSIERAIRAIIVDSKTEWRHDSALAVAWRYYYHHRRLDGFELWREQLDRGVRCEQDVCFGALTHGVGPDEVPILPDVVSTRGPES
jgi:hypothetical protein